MRLISQRPEGFSPSFYLHQNPDVAAAGADPFEHYRRHGWREGRDPAPDFSTKFYVSQFPSSTFRNTDPISHFNSLKRKMPTHPIYNRLEIGSASVGIVIVTYNCSDIALLTIEALRRIPAGIGWKLYVLDGGSRAQEKQRLRDFFSMQSDTSWFHFADDEINRGFSGNNNIAIQTALSEGHSHICLLNPDVVVTDGWLKDLIEVREIVVAPVSNAVGNEQTVPINYEIDKTFDSFRIVNSFARSWRHSFKPVTTYTNFLGFFCTLFRREVFDTVGLLDEIFYPGGFEDLDYCLRLSSVGVPLAIARHVFLHHWGSSSFSTLPMEERLQHVSANRERYEAKHQKPWVDWVYRIPMSAAQDAARLKSSLRGSVRRFQLDIMSKHRASTEVAIEQMRRDQESLLSARAKNARLLNEANERAKRIANQRDLLASKLRAVDDRVMLGGDFYSNGNLKSITCLSERPKLRTFDPARSRKLKPILHAVGNELILSQRPFFWALELLTPFLNEIAILVESRAIVFVTNGVDPLRADERDGYVQRIIAIDRLCEQNIKAYITVGPDCEHGIRFDWLSDTIVNVEICSSDPVYVAALNVLIGSAESVYVHSILALGDLRLRNAVAARQKVTLLDVHGSVPEEFLMNGDRVNATLYDAYERQISQNRNTKFICVTNAMAQHLNQKLGIDRNRTLTVPIFAMQQANRQFRACLGKPLTVYAGGSQLWQRIPDMAKALLTVKEATEWLLLCPNPEVILDVFVKSGFRESEVRHRIKALSHAQVLKTYEKCHYGLLLRAQSTVNRVACPTKMVEYLAFGIIPVLDFAEIGDFVEYGVQYLPLNEFAAGHLPNEAQRRSMVENNWLVYDRISGAAIAGRGKLRDLIDGQS